MASVGIHTNWPFFKRVKLSLFFNFVRVVIGFRKFIFKFIGPARPQATLTEYYPTTNGRKLRVDIFEPEAKSGAVPIHVHVHGCGFCVNTFRSDVAFSSALSKKAGVVVLSIDYSKSPEYPWPAALEDVEHAIEWAKTQAPGRGWDASRLTISGSSSGGVLALCAASSRPGKQDLKAVIAVYPLVDLAEDIDKKPFDQQLYPPEAGVNVSDWYAKLLFDAYLPPSIDRKNPRVSPAFAPLRNYPPTSFVLPEHDWARPEAEQFASKLRDVQDVAIYLAEGQSHGFDMLARPGTRSERMFHESIDFITKRLQAAYAA